MDTEFEYSVEWEGQAEPETMNLKEVQAVATAEFTDAEWLPPALRTLLEVGPLLPWMVPCAPLAPAASSRGRWGACLAAEWAAGRPPGPPRPSRCILCPAPLPPSF